jgi:hypothetical protein
VIVHYVRENQVGVYSFCSDDGTATADGIAAYKLFCSVIDSSGVAHTNSVAITGDAGQLTHVGCYPGNFVGNTGTLENPLDYPGFKYYMMWLADGVTPGDTQVSQTLVFLPADDYSTTCWRNNMITLAWVNSDGTYDYFQFPKVNQRSFQYERKRFKKVIGTYGSSTFDFEAYDRGLQEIDIISPVVIEMTSEWMSERDFRYIQHLFKSRSVFISDNTTQSYDDFTGIGSAFQACVVEGSDFIERRERNGKMFNMTLRVRIANDQWT